MGYAQPVRSTKTGDYFLARYLKADGRYGAVKDEHTGKTVHYERKRDAKKAADAAEAAVREGREKEAAKGDLTFGEWANSWYAALKLTPATMDNYREHMERIILPVFQDSQLRPRLEILPPDVDAWESQLRDVDGYAESSIATYRGTLRTCLAAAVPGVIPFNPAASSDRAGTGRRGVARAAAAAKAEKVITTVLGGLVLGERIAVLSGRDDEFVMTVTLQHAGLRLGEGIGLEAEFAGRGNIRVEWQLSEVRGKLYRAIPKDGSRGDVTVPYFLTDLLDWHAGHHPPVPCRCHGLAYVFTGPGVRRRRGGEGVTVRDVAAEAGVAPETVWAAQADDARVPQAVRAKVRAAARALGWADGAAPLDADWHWRHVSFERLFTAAASGWWPAHGKREPERPVPLAGEWPGKLLKYRGAQRLAEWGWLPVARGLTPHSLRHSMRTKMEELGVRDVFAELQLRHEQPSVYRHVTDAMRDEYRGKLQEAWDEALQRRGEMSPGSPVRVVGALLREASEGFVARNSQTGTVTALRGRR